MITDKELQDLGLESWENGYYNINDDFTVDVEGNIRYDGGHKSLWIATVINVEELKVFIKSMNR